MPETAEDSQKSLKLNILALPSHTSILFALIALVVLGAAFSSLLPGSQLWWPPIVLGLTLLPLRDFLRRPDRMIARWKMSHRRDEAAATIEDELASLGSDKSPQVLTTERSVGIHAFGSFSRSFLGLERSLAEAFYSGLKAPPGRRRDRFRAILAHELSHFLNHDVWLMWLSYGLLKMMVLVMLLDLWIGVNLSLFVIENGPEVLQPEFWANLSSQLLPDFPSLDLRPFYDTLYRQNPSLVERLADPSRRIENWQPFFFNLVASHWPFVASGVVLFLVYWRRLLRVRELYADARAASLMGESEIVLEAQTLYATLVAFTASVPSRWERLRGGLLRLRRRNPVLGDLLALHPMRQERIECLKEPLRALGSWRWIAVSVGLAVALLDFLLRGTLTASYIHEPGPHLPFLAAFTVFSTWLLPRVCMGANLRRNLFRLIVLIVSLFTFIKLIPHLIDAALAFMMILGDQGAWGAVIDLWAYSMSGGFAEELPRILGAEITWSQFIDWHIIRPIAYFTLLMPPTLVALQLIDASLKQRALTWYRLQQRVRYVFWGITGLLALVLVLMIIPLYNRILFPHIYSWSPEVLVGMVIALVAVLGGGCLFWNHDQEVAKRCPHCDTLIRVEYHLGKRCDDCRHLLHPWLIANY